MQFVHTSHQIMRSNVSAKLDILILVHRHMSYVQVNKIFEMIFHFHTATVHFSVFIDSCQVNNGGCDTNAICSHDTMTNEVKCTCKTGYTNTTSASNAVCQGNRIIP